VRPLAMKRPAEEPARSSSRASAGAARVPAVEEQITPGGRREAGWCAPSCPVRVEDPDRRRPAPPMVTQVVAVRYFAKAAGTGRASGVVPAGRGTSGSPPGKDPARNRWLCTAEDQLPWEEIGVTRCPTVSEGSPRLLTPLQRGRAPSREGRSRGHASRLQEQREWRRLLPGRTRSGRPSRSPGSPTRAGPRDTSTQSRRGRSPGGRPHVQRDRRSRTPWPRRPG
jgi:hypothetical protein